ncbi:1547_t:CDS:2 [Funneliformis caledonium]|uniref:1547_t:CDS:1 n=1 Tax=Funneliformis caledonium TaxID=1117310 RepID=A0A9N9GK38_9GLOM|nr:1547_t:CDS:2 [Funneliformis caledonium]
MSSISRPEPWTQASFKCTANLVVSRKNTFKAYCIFAHIDLDENIVESINSDNPTFSLNPHPQLPLYKEESFKAEICEKFQLFRHFEKTKIGRDTCLNIGEQFEDLTYRKILSFMQLFPKWYSKDCSLKKSNEN